MHEIILCRCSGIPTLAVEVFAAHHEHPHIIALIVPRINKYITQQDFIPITAAKFKESNQFRQSCCCSVPSYTSGNTPVTLRQYLSLPSPSFHFNRPINMGEEHHLVEYHNVVSITSIYYLLAGYRFLPRAARVRAVDVAADEN